MFGLLEQNLCHLDPAQKANYRRYYCGTCKAMGRFYSHKSRLFLNSDIVFVAELLDSSEEKTNLRDQKKAKSGFLQRLRKNQCFHIPAEKDIPNNIKIAALMNEAFIQCSLDDKVQEKSGRARRFSRYLFRREENKLIEHFSDLPISWKEIQDLVTEQNIRERTVLAKETFQKNPKKILDFVSEPTGQITGTMLHAGALFCGRGNDAKALKTLGHALGCIVYLLDALDDYQTDFRKRDFNAIRSAWNLNEQDLPDTVRENVHHILREYSEIFKSSLKQINISKTKVSQFISRLDSNLNRRLGRQCNCGTKSLSRKPKAGSDRYKFRWARAKSRAASLIKDYRKRRSMLSKWRYQTSITVISALFFALPSGLWAASSEPGTCETVCGCICACACMGWCYENAGECCGSCCRAMCCCTIFEVYCNG